MLQDNHFSMIINENKRLFKNTTLKRNKVETPAFKKFPLVHKIQLEEVIVTLCYSIFRVVILLFFFFK